MWWKAFWENLNIRKAIVLTILGLYVLGTVGGNPWVAEQDMKELILICMSYYFGYSNRMQEENAEKQKTKE